MERFLSYHLTLNALEREIVTPAVKDCNTNKFAKLANWAYRYENGLSTTGFGKQITDYFGFLSSRTNGKISLSNKKIVQFFFFW